MAKRILIVDDNKPLVRMMNSALETLPYKVKVNSVPSGEEALLAVMMEKPDLMVVDLHLPGMNGLDLIQIMQERHADLTIVMMTGEHDASVFKRAEEMGVEYRFPKPFETVAFLDAVNRIIHGQELDIHDLNLPSGPPERMEDQAPSLSFSDAVVELHQRLKATAVVIIGDSGRIIVQAGKDLAQVFSNGWELPIMASLSAAETVQRSMPGEAQSQVQIFQTSKASLLLVPVGRHGLVVVLPARKTNTSFQKEMELLLSVHQRISTFTPPFEVANDLPEVLERDTVPEEEIDEEVEVKEIDIATLFSNQAESSDADSFWEEEAVEQEAPAAPRGMTGYLDFSQAKQLGLTPEEEN